MPDKTFPSLQTSTNFETQKYIFRWLAVEGASMLFTKIVHAKISSRAKKLSVDTTRSGSLNSIRN